MEISRTRVYFLLIRTDPTASFRQGISNHQTIQILDGMWKAEPVFQSAKRFRSW